MPILFDLFKRSYSYSWLHRYFFLTIKKNIVTVSSLCSTVDPFVTTMRRSDSLNWYAFLFFVFIYRKINIHVHLFFVLEFVDSKYIENNRRAIAKERDTKTQNSNKFNWAFHGNSVHRISMEFLHLPMGICNRRWSLHLHRSVALNKWQFSSPIR